MLTLCIPVSYTPSTIGLLADDLHGRIHLSFRRFPIIIFAQICILIDVHIHPRHVIDGETGIGGRQSVFMDIQAVQPDLGRHTQADRFVNDLKDDKHHDQHIRHHTYGHIQDMDHQILVEADFLVNLAEDHASEEAVRHVLKTVFRTESGIRFLKSLWPV